MTDTVHLYDVVNRASLATALDTKLVRQQVHPDEPLAVLNYTDLAAAAGMWNPTTLACRGLIYRTDTLHVVARGWPKFFNHGQAGAPTIALDASVWVSDKRDGSLGIVHPLPSGGYAVATRGSFTSEQALHATAVLHDRYPEYEPEPGWTTLVEIIFPQNRIVLDYAGLDDLVLLGHMPLDGGQPRPPVTANFKHPWPGPVTDMMPAHTFTEALALPPRDNAEGIVVQECTTGNMVKVKQADYVALHKLVTGLTARTVWEQIVAGVSLFDFLAPLPDEFHDWVRNTWFDILKNVYDESARLHAEFDTLISQMPDAFVTAYAMASSMTREFRKEFAALASKHPDGWAMFHLLDGRKSALRTELLKRARPGPYLTPSGRQYTEATA